MRFPKHLPLEFWPDADRHAFDHAFAPGDIFDETCGPGAHLAAGTRKMVTTVYRRWLGYLDGATPAVLELDPAARITLPRVRAFVEHLEAEVRPTTVAHCARNLHYAARLIAPETNWGWLQAIAARLAALATPQDRFGRLVPNEQLLDLGLELIGEAKKLTSVRDGTRGRLFRDGLILSLLSLWPIRRRAIAALSVSRHVSRDEDGITLVLHDEDTKSGRSERFRVPDVLVSHLRHYLDKIRPAFPDAATHDGLWASSKGCLLSGSQIYTIVRRHSGERLGRPVGLQDVRRSAATFLAIDAPELASLIPGVLQHKNPEISDRHYTLARSMKASRRHVSALAELRRDLPIRRKRKED